MKSTISVRKKHTPCRSGVQKVRFRCMENPRTGVQKIHFRCMENPPHSALGVQKIHFGCMENPPSRQNSPLFFWSAPKPYRDINNL